jgi:hypothetical protein
MAYVKIIAGADEGSHAEIAANSLSIANGDMISLTTGFVAKAVAASTAISGIANGTKTYASDNQTVAKAKVNYLRVIPRETILELETSADATQANVGRYFTLTAGQKVDVATVATAKGVLPLMMVEYIGSTTKARFVAVQ